MSLAWAFFKARDDLPIIAICQLCQQEIKRGKLGSERRVWSTKPLITHLQAHHAEDFLAKQREMAPAAAAAGQEKEKKGITPGERKKKKMQMSILTGLYPHATNSKAYKSSDPRQRECNQKLLQMIIQDNQPFSVVDDPGFIAYSAALNPLYTLPSRKTISELLHPEYDRVRAKVQAAVDGAKFVSFTSDIWTDDTTKASFMSLSGTITIPYHPSIHLNREHIT
jgi:hypothetical protein